ncbi:M48 family metallopeptidase [Sulfurovum sp. XGS-02]|uniref:M48 family metallopeptidase n=1 Tax=Sulfurovum sp. XGS-02 TaxID=2925411 RepID=UPI002047A1DA|nr:SprT family zinc-dependent metalloprotease [Sulfurovum sp. XGS-02]UPT77460.1 M48 family metallopeptidase [Sulfurovum sp. XGS-02]
MSLLPQYTHIINPKLKHIYLSFDDEGNLVIKSPKVAQQKIEQLLLKKSSWINQAREKIQQKKGKPLDFSSDAEVYFMGEAYPLTLLQHSKKRTHLDFDGEAFRLFYHTYDERVFQTHLDRFYKTEAQKHIPGHVACWAQKMRLSPSDVRFRKTKRQWGSCSGKNVLSFNTMMMKLPHDVIQYIIVHELTHIKHKHHQKAFWQLVERYLPDYKEQVAELKNYMT